MDVAGTTKLEKALTWLGMWGATRLFAPIVVPLVGSILLLESLVPSAADLFPGAPLRIIHVVVVGSGLLLGLLGHFAAEFWDRVFFEAWYGPRGKWLDSASKPFHLFASGGALKSVRNQAAHHLAPKTDLANGIYREAVKIARRQVERWERVGHPLILSWAFRGLLWPNLVVAVLAFIAGIGSWLSGSVEEVPRLLAVAAACLILQLLLLACYIHFRMDHMLRLYHDVASHHAKRKS